MGDGPISTYPFGPGVVTTLLGSSRAALYVHDYLAELGAASILGEKRYIDRHYLEDFAAYHARSFLAPSSECCRYHFFRTLDEPSLLRLVDSAYSGNVEIGSVEEQLNENYLGFVVRRPIEGAEVGRTVLRTYPREGHRKYEVVRPYRVHVGGFQLSINGLAYQQQDGGAAVCASTALWSALQKVALIAGHRTPTPSMVTAAANSPYPASHGLDFEQMATAISNLGYVADLLVPGTNLCRFKANVVVALRSHLPVIFVITQRNGERAHAVTLTGYSDPVAIVEVPVPRIDKAEPPLPMTAGVRVVYVHDDALGSHAHYEIFDDREASPGSLMLRRGSFEKPRPSWWTPDEWEIQVALVPKPDKLRVSLDGLLLQAVEVRPMVRCIFEDDLGLVYDTFFATGVEYRKRVLQLPLSRTRMREFQWGLHLPRYVGIVSIREEDAPDPMLEIVLDATEVHRDPGVPASTHSLRQGCQRMSKRTRDSCRSQASSRIAS